MPVEFVTAASAKNDVSSSTATIPKPASVAAGNVMVLGLNYTVSATNYPIPITMPEGWSMWGQFLQTGSLASAMFIKVAGASEPASYDFGIGSSVVWVSVMSVYSGVDAAAPIDVSAIAGHGASTTYTTPSVTTTAADAMLCFYVGAANVKTHTPPAGVALRVEDSFPGTTARSAMLADQAQAAPGESGTRAFVATATGQAVVATVALNPASTDTTPPAAPTGLAATVITE